MGMLIAGKWTESDNIIKDGAYVRQPSNCSSTINAEDIINFPNRFYLIASWSCPWSHRTMLIRQVEGLADYIQLHITGGQKIQGYSADHGEYWQVPGSDLQIMHMHQLYTLNDEQYTGRSTVPILWDSIEQKIISNESTVILDILNSASFILNSQKNTKSMLSNHCTKSTKKLDDEIYHKLSNGVYRAGFAKTQSAYDEAVQQVFTMLQNLDDRLAQSKYLLGEQATLCDWLLFPTLVRFDLDYYLHSRCTLKRLSDYPNLWTYARRLYNFPGISETINFKAIHLSNYQFAEVVPLMPIQYWEI